MLHTPNVRGGSIYTQSARFDDRQHFLNEDEIRKLAPSVFARDAHPSRSERFAPIATYDVIKALHKEGFGVVGAVQSRALYEDRKNYAKHMLRLRRMDEAKKYTRGDSVFEIILKNANDGTAAYDMLSGLWRILCENSLVAMSNQMASSRVRHSGDVVHKVVDATYEVIKDAERALDAPDKWGNIQLDRREQMLLANAAHEIRFPVDDEGRPTTNITPDQLLHVRREEDRKPDLWATFNVIQENAIKGGLGARSLNNNRVTHTRRIKSIDQSTALNRALWTLGEEMARIKSGGLVE